MNKYVAFAFMALSLSIVGIGAANGVQANLFYPFLSTSNFQAPGHLDNLGNVLGNDGGTSSLLAASGAAAINVKATPGRIMTVNVITASGVIAVYDAATAGAAGATNEIASIPATVGVYRMNFPAASGITVNPNNSVISVAYQ